MKQDTDNEKDNGNTRRNDWKGSKNKRKKHRQQRKRHNKKQ